MTNTATLRVRVTLSLLAIATMLVTPASADTIRLKNGYSIDGMIDADESTDDLYVVTIGDSGLLRIRKSDVVSVEKNSLDAGKRPTEEGTAVPAVATGDAEMIEVTLKESPVYGGGVLRGVQSKRSDDTRLVLETPGAGTTTIAREAIEKIEPYSPIATSGARPVPTAAGGQTIATTHRLTMKNGRVLLGDVVARGEDQVVVQVGSVGRVLINPRWIDSISEEAGTITIPPEPEPVETQEEPADGEETTTETGAERVTTPDEEVAIDPALESEILDTIRELTRWRSRNRVRAENRLREIGEPAIGYLPSLMNHPFNLTRRAVMRVVRDVGSPEGTLLAIAALLDEDIWVRIHADEALRRITGRDTGYNPRAPLEQRLEAHSRWLDSFEPPSRSLATTGSGS